MKIGTKDKQILGLFRQEIPCNILFLIFSVVFSQNEVSIELNIHPALVSYHLKKNVKNGNN
jgi:hypothetical protein